MSEQYAEQPELKKVYFPTKVEFDYTEGQEEVEVYVKPRVEITGRYADEVRNTLAEMDEVERKIERNHQEFDDFYKGLGDLALPKSRLNVKKQVVLRKGRKASNRELSDLWGQIERGTRILGKYYEPHAKVDADFGSGSLQWEIYSGKNPDAEDYTIGDRHFIELCKKAFGSSTEAKEQSEE